MLSEELLKWCKDHIIGTWNEKDGKIYAAGSITIVVNEEESDIDPGWSELPVSFAGKTKSFSVSGLKFLKTLKGCPEEVDEFDCSFCNSLENLIGSPSTCKNFTCYSCDNLKTLEGAPKKVEYFTCSECDKLSSLEFAPEEVDTFECKDCQSLVSLKGAPKIAKTIDCSRCKKMTSLIGCPTELIIFKCVDCKSLKSLKGLPNELEGLNMIGCSSLETLRGIPVNVSETFAVNMRGCSLNKYEKMLLGEQFKIYGLTVTENAFISKKSSPLFWMWLKTKVEAKDFFELYKGRIYGKRFGF